MACRNRVERIRRLPTRSQHVPAQLEDPLIEKPSTERQKNPLAIQVLCECHLISRSPGHPSGSIVVGEGNVYLQPERLPSWPIPAPGAPGPLKSSDRRSGWNFRAGPLLQELENMHEGFHLSCVPFRYIYIYCIYNIYIYSMWLDTTGKSQLWAGKYWIIIKLKGWCSIAGLNGW